MLRAWSLGSGYHVKGRHTQDRSTSYKEPSCTPSMTTEEDPKP